MATKRHSSQRTPDRKTAQLCAQVERALHYIVPELLVDLQFDASITDVKSAPNASHLMVLVSVAGAPLEELGSIESILVRQSGFIRTEVARSIHRRKTPTLSFVLVPS